MASMSATFPANTANCGGILDSKLGRVLSHSSDVRRFLFFNVLMSCPVFYPALGGVEQTHSVPVTNKPFWKKGCAEQLQVKKQKPEIRVISGLLLPSGKGSNFEPENINLTSYWSHENSRGCSIKGQTKQPSAPPVSFQCCHRSPLVLLLLWETVFAQMRY